MIKVTASSGDLSPVINMNEMKPLQVAVITNGGNYPEEGHLVMRTASKAQFEVLDLTNPRPSGCWTGSCGEQRVTPLPDGTRLTFTVTQNQGGEI